VSGRFQRGAPAQIDAETLVAPGKLAGGAVGMLTARTALDALGWAEGNRDRLMALLEGQGAVLMRGFAPLEQQRLADLVRLVAGGVIEYEYASTPRSKLGKGVYTSTEYPADRNIPLHNEMSYARRYPRWLAFLCVTPAPTGGRTPLADSAAVCRAVPDTVRERFRSRGVRYLRTFGAGLDLGWSAAFATDDPAEVEAYCAGAGISWEWRGGGVLRTWQDCPAIVAHPGTGEDIWFNQATLFHPDSLPEETRASLVSALGPDGLSRDVRFADGGPIGAGDLAAIRAAYDGATISFDWEAADILLVDNLRYAHGREPFSGPRRILVAMGGGAGS
jgi:alpha-ketoglutarate-dependent taurine dioxygenase